MDDLEFRRRVLQGETLSTAIEQAANGNPQRQRWLQQARAVETQLQQTLQQPPPHALTTRLKQIPATHALPRYPLLMTAAVLILIVSAGLFVAQYPFSLNRAVVQHIAAEPDSLYQHQRLPSASVNLMARQLGYVFNQPQTNISYIGACAVRGRQALHLTVQGAGHSATLLLLPHESLRQRHTFSHHSLYGRLIPLTRGSAAIVSSSRTLLDQLEATTLQQLTF